MRINEDRLQDFRTTIKEIVDVNLHNGVPNDVHELDNPNYGRLLTDKDTIGTD